MTKKNSRWIATDRDISINHSSSRYQGKKQKERGFQRQIERVVVLKKKI